MLPVAIQTNAIVIVENNNCSLSAAFGHLWYVIREELINIYDLIPSHPTYSICIPRPHSEAEQAKSRDGKLPFTVRGA